MLIRDRERGERGQIQRQHLSAAKNRKLCGAALASKGELCGRVRRKLSNYAAKLRRIFTKSAVIVRHFQLIFGSNLLQLYINDVVGRPDQTSKHQKQQKHCPARPRVSEFF